MLTDLGTFLTYPPLNGSPFGYALVLCLILATACLLISVITREYSWVDRLWQICPILYCIVVLVDTELSSSRINLMSGLVIVWGVRLSFNLARKGGFTKGNEDYRWLEIRKRIGETNFQLLNVSFISYGQMLIVWLFTAPIHQAWLMRATPLNVMDFIAFLLFTAFLIGESVADEQMWKFQESKKQRIANSKVIEKPYLDTGLFKISRHPSYFCEMGIWFSFYLFAIAGSNEWLHWTGLGFVSLVVIFLSSSRLTETISLRRYPSYREYQARVPRLVPFTRFGCINKQVEVVEKNDI